MKNNFIRFNRIIKSSEIYAKILNNKLKTKLNIFKNEKIEFPKIICTTDVICML